MASAMVTQLASEIAALRLQRDQALAREAETTYGLQRMLGADKAAGVLVRALWGDCLAALHVWRQHASEISLSIALDYADPGRRRYAEAVAADAAARLEIEETRRQEAEKLAFDEGKRRRRAEAALSQAQTELGRITEDAALSCRNAAAGLGERAADALAARSDRQLLGRAFASWCVVCSQLELSQVEERAAPLATRLATLEGEMADADAARAAAAEAARTAADELRAKLRTAQREASEAHLGMLSARQQRAEAMAKAAAEEEGRMHELARAEALDLRHAALIANLGASGGGARVLRSLGPAFRAWGRMAEAQRAMDAGRAEMAEAAAAATAAMRERAEAASMAAAESAAQAAAARDDGERSTAAAEMRLRRCEASRHAERRRHAVEAGVLITAELSACEGQLRRAEGMLEATSRRLCETRVEKADAESLRGVLAEWRELRWLAREERLGAQLDHAKSTRRAAAERAEALVALVERARERAACLMGDGANRRAVAFWLGGWRSLVRDAQRQRAAQAAEAQAEASASREAAMQMALANASREADELRGQLAEREGAFEAEARRRRELESELAEMQRRLEGSEVAARDEAARAAQLEEEAQALEVELQACELKLLMLDEQAVRQAEDIHEQLRDTLIASPNPGRPQKGALGDGGVLGGLSSARTPRRARSSGSSFLARAAAGSAQQQPPHPLSSSGSLSPDPSGASPMASPLPHQNRQEALEEERLMADE